MRQSERGSTAASIFLHLGKTSVFGDRVLAVIARLHVVLTAIRSIRAGIDGKAALTSLLTDDFCTGLLGMPNASSRQLF
jgi:hypothetical protein